MPTGDWNADAIARLKMLKNNIGVKMSQEQNTGCCKNTSPEGTFRSDIVRVKKLDPYAIIPTQSHRTDAGFDLYAVDNIRITPGLRVMVSTGIAFEIPDGMVGLIWPRSGLAAKKGIDVLAGVIDAGYRGEIKVVLLNTTHPPGQGYEFVDASEAILEVRAGDRIAQIIFHRIPSINMHEVTDLSESARDIQGFGGSGK